MSKEKHEQSMIGKIIDLPLEDFKKELIEQRVTIGVMQNLHLNLVGAYNELVNRKELLISNSNLPSETVKKTVEGIYCEMLKIEEKVVYLKERINELIKVD